MRTLPRSTFARMSCVGGAESSASIQYAAPPPTPRIARTPNVTLVVNPIQEPHSGCVVIGQILHLGLIPQWENIRGERPRANVERASILRTLMFRFIALLTTAVC